ncbi:hypothetical protein Q31b_44430 [Novipirellula aureliae]|uniref:GNT-I family protein n=1 Tax=Novipirellula aureliae TaxID=2527966 RepID=A0A5C6DNA5_9BACT|nr:glycosyltransferase family A protein [Novipirellula aureliae]TWU37655.1 hypothetical protein Q31b_44430 [Novipirellula aureliae]
MNQNLDRMENGTKPIAPAIVVCAFDRPSSLTRLLKSLAEAEYRGYTPTLHISVDFSGTSKNEATIEIAKRFQWKHGECVVDIKTENLGLKKHVLSCGDLSAKYGSVIVLEDDLFVSPCFYLFAHQCVQEFGNHPRIAGISLHRHRSNFNLNLPFDAADDGSDVFFMRVAQSWGQLWTHSQWKSFRHWLDANPDAGNSAQLQPTVRGWGAKSWLKLFMAYLIENDLYMVYPRTSLTTNFSEAGTHVKRKRPLGQVPLMERINTVRFPDSFDRSIRYDEFFERQPESMRRWPLDLPPGDVDLNLYGAKSPDSIRKKFVIAPGDGSSAIASFPLQMRPLELNLLLPELPSVDLPLHLTLASNYKIANPLSYTSPHVCDYFLGHANKRKMLKSFVNAFFEQLASRLRR